MKEELKEVVSHKWQMLIASICCISASVFLTAPDSVSGIFVGVMGGILFTLFLLSRSQEKNLKEKLNES